MKNQLMMISLSSLLIIFSMTGCSNSAPRITPGHLAVTDTVTSHTAKITNIVQLAEKEASGGKLMLGHLAGALIAGTLTEDKSDLAQDLASNLGSDIGEAIVIRNYGKTIYKLTLSLNDGSVKHIHVRGGAYVVGRHAKITVDKKSGNITSLLALKT